MPWKIVKSGEDGYYVVNKHTGKKMSRRPLPSRARAKAQLRALHANVHDFKEASGWPRELPYPVLFPISINLEEPVLEVMTGKAIKFGRRYRKGAWGNIEGLAKHLSKKYGGDPHFFTKCYGSDELQRVVNYKGRPYNHREKAEICAVAHKKATGKWPGEHERKKETDMTTETLKGGPGSGNFGHAGRPGKVGGSADGKTTSSRAQSGVAERKVSHSSGLTDQEREIARKFLANRRSVQRTLSKRARGMTDEQISKSLETADARVRAIGKRWEAAEKKGPISRELRRAHRQAWEKFDALNNEQQRRRELSKSREQMSETARGAFDRGRAQLEARRAPKKPAEASEVGDSFAKAVKKYPTGEIAEETYFNADRELRKRLVRKFGASVVDEDIERIHDEISAGEGKWSPAIQQLNQTRRESLIALAQHIENERKRVTDDINKVSQPKVGDKSPKRTWSAEGRAKRDARKREDVERGKRQTAEWAKIRESRMAEAKATKITRADQIKHRFDFMKEAAEGGKVDPAVVRSNIKFIEKQMLSLTPTFLGRNRDGSDTTVRDLSVLWKMYHEILPTSEARYKPKLASVNRRKELASESSIVVFKEKGGKFRWVTVSSTAFRDRDGEIVSTKALMDDVMRADHDGDFGPLRWWHVPGADIGDCDYNALFGRTLVESGTFRDERVARAIKENSDKLRVSIGFKHPATEPDAEGVFSTIRRFERSILPRDAASNAQTGILVKGEH